MIDSFDVDTVIYTDGSCSGGMENGGSAALVTTGSAEAPGVLEELTKVGPRYTCSYDEERTAMEMAVSWVEENSPYTDVVICSDSQSLLMAISHQTADTARIRKSLDALKNKTTIQWVPSHSNIPGNELADKAAKAAAKLERPDDLSLPISYNTAKSIIKRLVSDPNPSHARTAQVYEHYSSKKEARKITSRAAAALLAQLRSGHCLKLAHYRHRINNTESETCPKCGDEPKTVEHWIATCPALWQERLSHFGRMDVNLGALGSYPAEVLAYAKATLEC